MIDLMTKIRNISWQIVLAWIVGLISVVNIVIINIFPIDQVRDSAWIYSYVLTHFCSFIVASNTAIRESIVRRKIGWILVAASSFLGVFRFVFRIILLYDDIFIIIGIFIFMIISLAIYFPKSIWSTESILRIIFDISMIAVAVIALLQALIYYYFGRNETSVLAAFRVGWIGFEIGGFTYTIFLWQRYRQRLLIFIVFAGLCIVLSDMTGLIRQWYPGVYRISGLPDLSLNYISLMSIMIFGYYSVNYLEEVNILEQPLPLFNRVFRIFLPILLLSLSLCVSLFIQRPNEEVLLATCVVFVLQVFVVSLEEGKLSERIFDAMQRLKQANQELERRKQIEAELAVQRTRTAMARDIHDSLGGHLHAASSIASTLAGIEALPPQIRQMLNLLYTSVADAHREMRRAITVLQQTDEPAEPAQTLEAALAVPVADAQRYGPPIVVTVVGPSRPVAAKIVNELVRVTQEALTNTRKYAKATEVRISVDYTDTAALVLMIADNGVGMATPTGPRADGTGNGLNNMRVRIEALGGQFDLPPAQQGVTLWMRIPL